jgi:hypothetical protein
MAFLKLISGKEDGGAIPACSEGLSEATPLVRKPSSLVHAPASRSDASTGVPYALTSIGIDAPANVHHSKYFGSKLTPDFFSMISSSSRKLRVR